MPGLLGLRLIRGVDAAQQCAPPDGFPGFGERINAHVRLDGGVLRHSPASQVANDFADAVYLVLVSHLVDNTDTYYVTSMQAVTTADLDVLDHILKTFNAAS